MARLYDAGVVKSYEVGKSPYGPYNMAGNVWEWTSSNYDGSSKVIRGGSWDDDAGWLHSSLRVGFAPTPMGHAEGFRCAQDAK